MPEAKTKSPALVALASWIVPGLGYWLIGQRARGTTIGVTVILLFMLGLLIGGVRVIDVPGYDSRGQKMMVVPRGQPAAARWIMTVAPMTEIREKPWSIAQVLTGPIGVLSGMWSIHAATPADGSAGGPSIGAESHAHVHDIGTLYTAVAGMLNLLAIIDASSRAGEERAK